MLPSAQALRLHKRAEAAAVDRAIAEVAAAQGGRYSVERHLQHDPAATTAFAETHLRRLEAMQRLSHSVERDADGSWIITPDHLEKAAAHARRLARNAPVVIEVLSTLEVAHQAGADGATWLDRELVAGTPSAARDMGFGREVKEALAQRRQWLIAEDLARQEEGRTIYRSGLLARLRRRELARVADQLTGELGLPYREAKSGVPIEGIYRRKLDLVSAIPMP